MEDLLDKFEVLINDCRHADKMLNSTEDKEEEEHWSDVLNHCAVELYDFLIGHDATVTFAAPPSPPDSAELGFVPEIVLDSDYEWVAFDKPDIDGRRGNWYRRGDTKS